MPAEVGVQEFSKTNQSQNKVYGMEVLKTEQMRAMVIKLVAVGRGEEGVGTVEYRSIGFRPRSHQP